MADLAAQEFEQQLISDEWSVQVEELLRAESLQIKVSRRAPKAMLTAKEDAYIPQIVSLGPYHHRALNDASLGPYQHPLTPLSYIETYKLQLAREAARGSNAVMERVFTELTDRPTINRVERFYDWRITELRNFGWMMTVDAFFLFQFLNKCLEDDHSRSREVLVLDTMPSISCIRCDIVKLENQIPLLLLDKVKNAVPAEKFDLHSRVKSLSKFPIPGAGTKDLDEEEHLLGCIHKYVSSFLRIQTRDQHPTRPSCWQRISKLVNVVGAVGRVLYRPPDVHGDDDFLKRYNAEDLVKAGIKFKPFPRNGQAMIRFNKYSLTLYLPQIEVVEGYTEVMLKNLMALEFNEPKRPKSVTEYVALMGRIMEAPRDVSLLRRSGVIVRRSMNVSDEYVAEMWGGLCKTELPGAMEPPSLLKTQIQRVVIDNFYKTRIKTMWRMFKLQQLATPFQVMCLLIKLSLVGFLEYRLISWNTGIKCNMSS